MTLILISIIELESLLFSLRYIVKYIGIVYAIMEVTVPYYIDNVHIIVLSIKPHLQNPTRTFFVTSNATEAKFLATRTLTGLAFQSGGNSSDLTTVTASCWEIKHVLLPV